MDQNKLIARLARVRKALNRFYKERNAIRETYYGAKAEFKKVQDWEGMNLLRETYYAQKNAMSAKIYSAKDQIRSLSETLNISLTEELAEDIAE